ncbi:MAG: MFS transporter [Ferrovibrionaceae bacterium]
MSDQKPPSPFAPLRQPLFAVLWAATVLGNIGSFMRDVASAWIATGLSSSPVAVALVQVAGTLPVFLLSLPAGVLADILDRRRFAIGVQVMLAMVSATLMILAHTGMLTITSLIALTFAGGVGAALMGPTWQSIVPELVQKRDLRNAVALGSLGINIARAIGPAAGGLLLAAAGAALTYGADVATYVLVVAALLWWRRPAATDDALSESFFGAFRAGLRYARASRELHVVLLRTAVFFAFGSAIWALLPLVARNLIGGDAGFYGMLLGLVGIGAILGALVMPRLRGRVGPDGLLLGASLIAAAVMGALSLAPPKWLAMLLMLPLGAGWIAALTTLNGTAQAILPGWVRGRALAIYLTVFNGAMAGGSLGWGLLAQEIGVPATLMAGAAGLALVALALFRIALPTGESDLQPSNHWPEPLVADPVENDRGPVLILIEYRIDPANRTAFLKALHRLSTARRRDGAYGWGVTEDAAEPRRIVEWFMVESWGEHMRQHRRALGADADIQREVAQYHEGPDKPAVSHLLTIDARRTT